MNENEKVRLIIYAQGKIDNAMVLTIDVVIKDMYLKKISYGAFAVM